jgi:hypothetical protein
VRLGLHTVGCSAARQPGAGTLKRFSAFLMWEKAEGKVTVNPKICIIPTNQLCKKGCSPKDLLDRLIDEIMNAAMKS